MTDDSPIIKHEHGVTTQWTTRGYFGRIDCACCGFSMIGENRTLHVRKGNRGIDICDGCVNAIGAVADGEQHYSDGTVRK